MTVQTLAGLLALIAALAATGCGSTLAGPESADEAQVLAAPSTTSAAPNEAGGITPNRVKPERITVGD
jgi:hypothetical protein